MGNLFTEEVGKVLTRLLGNYLTGILGKVLDIYKLSYREHMTAAQYFWGQRTGLKSTLLKIQVYHSVPLGILNVEILMYEKQVLTEFSVWIKAMKNM